MVIQIMLENAHGVQEGTPFFKTCTDVQFCEISVQGVNSRGEKTCEILIVGVNMASQEILI